ncbi:MAG: hypothetical protein IJS71_00715 [Clostridia bacterium]|nr:hypothetical protein [Clostridia bacterium]
MNNETIFNAISKLDGELVDGSLPTAKPARRKTPIALKLVLAAAALVAAAGIGAGVSAYTAEVREYNNALDFFSSNSLSTEGLSRSEIKEVYHDITTNTFSNSATATAMNNSIPGLDLDVVGISSAELNSAWFSNVLITKAKSYVCNSLRSTVDPGFDIPEGCTLYGNGFYVCEDFPEASYEAFISELEGIGYSSARTLTGAFLFRDDCAVFLSYYVDRFELCWYKTSPYAPKYGISVSEAKKLLCPEKSLSPIDFHPIDVTPEGFYVKTGGQIFAVPTYSYDEYANWDGNGMSREENEHYFFAVYYVKGSQVSQIGMDKIAIFDIDGDGDDEVCILSYGPTSGVFTFGVTVEHGGATLSRYFLTNHAELSFAEADDTVKIRAVEYLSGEEHFFDIKIESSDGNDTVALYENGEPVRSGGS